MNRYVTPVAPHSTADRQPPLHSHAPTRSVPAHPRRSNSDSAISKAVLRVLSATPSKQRLETQKLEDEFAGYYGARSAFAVTSGAIALQLALRACGVGERDEVITTTLAHRSTSDAIRHIGAEPVFVDIDPISRNLDPNELEGVVNARTKAIVAVHLHGKPADMGRMMGIGHRYGIRVVESATEALGARYLGRQVGAIGDIACFGCDQHDMLSSGGDAGIVITSAPDLAAALDEVAGFGSPSPHRLHPLRAAVLRVKLRWLDHDSQVRRQLGYEYQQALAGAPVGLPAEDRSTQHGYGMFVIRSACREYLMQCLLSAKVGTGIHYPIPLHLSLSSRYLNYAPGDFPESEQASREVLSLPLHPDMDAADVRYVSESVTAALDFVSR